MKDDNKPNEEKNSELLNLIMMHFESEPSTHPIFRTTGLEVTPIALPPKKGQSEPLSNYLRKGDDL